MTRVRILVCSIAAALAGLPAMAGSRPADLSPRLAAALARSEASERQVAWVFLTDKGGADLRVEWERAGQPGARAVLRRVLRGHGYRDRLHRRPRMPVRRQ